MSRFVLWVSEQALMEMWEPAWGGTVERHLISRGRLQHEAV
jgi:hypothetical protein